MLRLLWALPLWLLLTPIALIRWIITRFQRGPRALEIILEGEVDLLPGEGPPWRRWRGTARRQLRRDLRERLRDRRVQIVLLRIGALSSGLAQLTALRGLIGELKALAGRDLKIVAYVHQPGTRSLWLASAADEIVIPPHAPVMAMGSALELNYYGEALDKAGIDVDVVSAGAFKSAMEPFTRTGPSEASAEALNALLDDLHEQLVADLAARPGADEAQIRAALDSGPHLAAAAVAHGLADQALDLEALYEALDCHEDGKLDRLTLDEHPGVVRPWPQRPRLRQRPAPLAVLPVIGAIRDGDLEGPDRGRGVTGRQVVELADAARKRKRVKGVLLYVDSPGGSATASEEMWRAIRRLAAEKPVVVWMGDYAASGGYYVASAAHHIVASPATLTGSIGVIAAKPHAERLMARLGVHTARFERGPQATMFSLARGFTEAERVAMVESITAFYDLFLARVAEGRDRTPESVHPVAQGRVWTGHQALGHGLVDSLGDEQAALRLLAERAGVAADLPLQLLRPKRPLVARILAQLGPGAMARQVEALAEQALGADLGPLTLDPAQLDTPRCLTWCPIRVKAR